MARFELPQLEDVHAGWGPVSLPSGLGAVPFAPFNKDARVGRVSDWSSKYQHFNRYGAAGGWGRGEHGV